MLDRLAVGRVLRSHGIEGFLRVEVFCGETSHLAEVPAVDLEPGPTGVAVEAVRQVAGGILLKLRGIDSPEDAASVRGSVVWVPRRYACPLASGEFYVGDLEGCEVRQGGAVVGRVQAFVEGGATGLLKVEKGEGGSFLVPFVDACVGEVSVERRTVDLREGFEVP